jgi:ArsR family transcriptional regulator
MLRALAHPVRICIVRGLIEKPSNVSNIYQCLELPQSTVSQHLSVLRSRGIVAGRRQGTEVVYYIQHPLAVKIINAIIEKGDQEN